MSPRPAVCAGDLLDGDPLRHLLVGVVGQVMGDRVVERELARRASWARAILVKILLIEPRLKPVSTSLGTS